MKKIVITGSNGLLGQTLVNLLMKAPENYSVFGLSKGDNRMNRNDFLYYDIDITNYSQLEECITYIQPSFIINTAAMTNVDTCELKPEECNNLNIEAVKYLTQICTKLNIHFIQISTDFIFDGSKGIYKETDLPNPLSIYGHSKLKAENIVKNSGVNFSILRTILVYGKGVNLKRNNIVLWVKDMLENNKEITIVDDQYRMPTYVEDLAMACKLIVDKNISGVYHISSNELLSVFEIANQIADVFGLNKKLIKPISSKTLNQKAIRPQKTGFDLSKTIKELDFQPTSFLLGLKRFKQTLS
ncbi:SDR family oxidoreductase [Flavobacteriaceae bacterium]|jgi:dTDP-4-dehydrorhamnose reductase|nr:SDR family oxidoreductase [Flavobacteriaceae bacterium]